MKQQQQIILAVSVLLCVGVGVYYYKKNKKS